MKHLIITCLLTFGFTLVIGQDISIVTEISNDTILLGNTGELRFTAKNAEVKFEGPDFDNIQIISGPNVSSSMQFVNGKMSSSISYSYIFYPNEIGEYFISPSYFSTQDTVYETPTVSIIVLPNPKEVKQPKGKFKVVDRQSYNKSGSKNDPNAVLRKKKKRI